MDADKLAALDNYLALHSLERRSTMFHDGWLITYIGSPTGRCWWFRAGDPLEHWIDALRPMLESK